MDTRTGDVLVQYQLSAAGAPAFINDVVVVTNDAAWFTDSINPVIHKVPLGAAGGLPTAEDITELPLSGDLVVIELSRDGVGGQVERQITDPRFDVPTTAAVSGGRLYLPNARFGTPSPATASYSVTGVPLR